MTRGRLSPRDLARQGEDLAVRFLQARGWEIHARNVRTPYGEIDIIARDRDTWVFVEVKTRRSLRFGWPEEAISARKWQALVHSALHWLEASEQPDDVPWRIDVIAIVVRPGHTPDIRHFEAIPPPGV